VEPLRRGGEAGVDELLVLRRSEDERALVTDATRTDGSALERCCFGDELLVVELRRHRRRLRPLAVDEMLAVSESRIWLGERNCDSGTGWLVATVNARACVGVGAEDVGEMRGSVVPLIESVEGSVPFARVGERGSSTLRGSVLMMAANCGPDGAATEEVGSAREREREDEREETTLRTRSRRLLDDEDGANVRWLLSRPRVLLELGVGVGIPLSNSGAGELLILVKAEGRVRLVRSLDATLPCSL
jgi:hypothetical protein